MLIYSFPLLSFRRHGRYEVLSATVRRGSLLLALDIIVTRARAAGLGSAPLTPVADDSGAAGPQEGNAASGGQQQEDNGGVAPQEENVAAPQEDSGIGGITIPPAQWLEWLQLPQPNAKEGGAVVQVCEQPPGPVYAHRQNTYANMQHVAQSQAASAAC